MTKGLGRADKIPHTEEVERSRELSPPTDRASQRRLPYDEVAEAQLLGAMLLSERALAVGMTMVSAADFYVPKHVMVCLVMGRLQGRPVNVESIAAELKRMEVVGPGAFDRSYLDDLVSITCGPAFTRRHAERVVLLACGRKVIRLAAELDRAGRSHEPALDVVAMVYDGLRAVLQRVRELGVRA
jgi:replicative DNA helicase